MNSVKLSCMKLFFLYLFVFFISSASLAESKKAPQNFYQKFQKSHGLLIKGSSQIDERSLLQASQIVGKMISKRMDIKERLISNAAEIAIIAQNESYCDLPEARDLRGKKTFDGRDFCKICGGGGVVGRPITAICEDNLLKTKNDPYKGKEDILTHEFAHTMHLLGMNREDKKSVTKIYQTALKNKLFRNNRYGKPAYMMANEQEFFACLSAIWFGVHNSKSASLAAELSDREAIKNKLPSMYNFLKSIYPE